MHRPASVDVVASLFAATATKAGLFISILLMCSGLAGDNRSRGGIQRSSHFAADDSRTDHSKSEQSVVQHRTRRGSVDCPADAAPGTPDGLTT